jgi:hypothetical protein
LAWAYKQAERPLEALEQLRRALVNVITPEPTWSITTHNFEESITGRIGYEVAEQLQAEIRELEETLSSGTDTENPLLSTGRQAQDRE